jgi:hypothetical protein
MSLHVVLKRSPRTIASLMTRCTTPAASTVMEKAKVYSIPHFFELWKLFNLHIKSSSAVSPDIEAICCESAADF